MDRQRVDLRQPESEKATVLGFGKSATEKPVPALERASLCLQVLLNQFAEAFGNAFPIPPWAAGQRRVRLG